MFGAEITQRETVESDFDEVLGFGARDEDVWSDEKFEAPEFLFAGEVLGRFAAGAALKQSEIIFGDGGGKDFFGMREEPGAFAAGGVEKEEFGGEGVRGDFGGAELRDALF